MLIRAECPTVRSARQLKKPQPSAFSGICCTNATPANATSSPERRAPPRFAPIFNVIEFAHADLFKNRRVSRAVADGFAPPVAAGRAIARLPTSRRGHRQYLQLGP